MQIHELPSIKKRSQRVGRSGKRGTTSGRGQKGQKSRSGRRMRPAERDLILRIPKQRGFKNAPKENVPAIFNLEALLPKLKSFAEGKGPLALNPELLKAAGLLRKNFTGRIKILGDGEIGIALRVEKIQVSKSAKAKIEKAGGSVVANGSR